MSDEKDKVETKAKGIDVSGYMPPGPGPGPVSPCPPYPPCPPPCPPEPCHYEKMSNLACQLKKLLGQQVTAYVTDLGPIAPVPVLPTGGGAVVPGTGALGLTGMLHDVGMDYIVLHVMITTMRVVYIPMMALAAVVPGGPLEPEMAPNVATTLPETI